jgi:hypothetical protein
MKKLLILILSFTMLSFISVNSEYKAASYIIENNSKISINGSTNVSTFDCILNFTDAKSSVTAIFQISGNKIKFEDAKLNLANSRFDCGNKSINKDFLEMLSTNNYPNIVLDLKEITKSPNNENEILALVNISLAGCSKFYSVRLNTAQGKSLKATGILKLKLSDFNLKPPKKVLGLIVVEDTLEINLDLNMKPLQ